MPNTLDQHRAVNIGQPQPNDLARLSKIDVWPQIIGGQTVNDPKMFPWFARLITTGTCKYPKPEDKDKAGGCGGTLISKRLIATAFHCVGQKEVKNINGQDIIVDTEILCNPSTTDKDLSEPFPVARRCRKYRGIHTPATQQYLCTDSHPLYISIVGMPIMS